MHQYLAISLSLLVGCINCESTCKGGEENGYTWPDTSPGSVAELNCEASGSSNLQGVIKRMCGEDGSWGELDLSVCVNPMFKGVQEELDTLDRENPGVISVSEGIRLANKLSEATIPPSGTQGAFISPAGIKSGVDALQLLQESINKKSGTEKREAIAGFGSQWFRSCSNVIDPRNAPSFMSPGTNALALTNKLVDSLDGITGDFGDFSTAEQMINHANLRIVGGPVQTPQNGDAVTFPTTMSMSGGETVQFNSENLATLSRLTGNGNSPVRIGMSVSDGLSDIIKVVINSTKSRTPISKFLTIGAGGQRGRIEFRKPITITFDLSGKDRQFQDSSKYQRSCGYWNTSLGVWSKDGLESVSSAEANTSKFVCTSMHLTSFSVLVKTTPFNEDLSYAEELALSIVTYYLSIVSLIALVSAIVVFLLLRQELFKKDIYMVHLNYAISLAVSLTFFIFGVELAKDNYYACTIISVILHYFFLSVFAWSFCEAVLVMYMLFALFATRKIYPYLMLVGWGLPIPVVVVSLIVRWYDYGVVGEYCWLSTENGLIGSFIGPALTVVFINTVLLIISIVRIMLGLQVKMRQMTRVKQARAALIGTFILVPLLGIPWIVAVLNLFVSFSLFQWIFVLLNTPQGLMFFLLYVVNNRELTKKVFCKKAAAKHSSRNTQMQRASQYSPNRSVITQFRKPSTHSLNLNLTETKVDGGEAKPNVDENEFSKGLEKEGFVGVNNPAYSPEHV